MNVLLSWLCWGACQEGVCLNPHFHGKRTSPRWNGELPAAQCRQKNTPCPDCLFCDVSTQSLTLKMLLLSRCFYRVVAILTLNTLIVCACFEVAALGVFKIARVLSPPTEQLVGEGSPREKVSYYSSQNWAKQYWHEFRLSRKQQYYPYVGWRRAPFKGKTIEIDQNGVRLTPGADCSATSFKVFTFGASEMWGTGSPNWGTIPANLQKGLAKLRQGPVCVMNFAESAYVVMQDVIMLLMQLRSDNVPM